MRLSTIAAKWLLPLPGSGPLLIVMAVAMAYLFAASIAPTTQLPADVEIIVTATGKKNAQSKGSEVWIVGAPGLDPTVPPSGWTPRENRLIVSSIGQPNRLTWFAKVGSTRQIELYKHPFSGFVDVTIGSVTKSFDLYSPEPGVVRLRVIDLVKEGIGTRSIIPLVVFFACLVVLIAIGRFIPRFPLLHKLSKHHDGKNPNAPTGETSSSSGPLQAKASLLVFISAAVAAHVLLENRAQIGTLGMGLTFGWFVFILWLELIAIEYLSQSHAGTSLKLNLPPTVVEDVALFVAFAINLYCTFLVSLNDGSTTFYAIMIGASLLFSGIIFVSAFEAVRTLCYVFCAVFALSIVTKSLSSPVYQVTYRDGQSAALVTNNAQSDVRRPNIYFLSLDGVGSRTAVKQLFRTADLPLWSILERNNYLLRDAKSPGAYTLETFYKLFTLRPTAEHASFDFLLGFDESPIIDRLKKAQYRIQSIQGTSYFGILNGLWDHFSPTSRAPLDYCWSIPSSTFFFGICRIPKPDFLHYDSPEQQLGRIEARVSELVASRSPWFTFAHVVSPGHTDNTFNFADENGRKAFSSLYLSRLDDMYRPLESLLTTIRQRDPTAIVILHSDHGPWLTRGWSKQADRGGLYNETLVAMDRTAVFLAVYPSNFCSDRLNAMATTAEMLPAVFECLGI